LFASVGRLLGVRRPRESGNCRRDASAAGRHFAGYLERTARATRRDREAIFVRDGERTQRPEARFAGAGARRGRRPSAAPRSRVALVGTQAAGGNRSEIFARFIQ
jgi:hypothetical protein